MYSTRGHGTIKNATTTAPSRGHGNVNHSPRKGGRTAAAANTSGKFPNDYGSRSPRFGTETPPWLRENYNV